MSRASRPRPPWRRGFDTVERAAAPHLPPRGRRGLGEFVGRIATLGFEAEALLRDHVRDRGGRLHDLLILAHPLTERSAALATTGFGEALL
jgi:hypothetical protein